ncbi:ATP-binding protein [Skermania sp. ID1734]|nr:ATP-binding protein [Skermania sp. ID1734]
MAQASGSSFAVRAEATPAKVAETRNRLRDWAIENKVDAQTVNDMVLATYEALANVVEHAYGGRTGVFLVRALAHRDQLIVRVQDSGCWTTPKRATNGLRGRGIELMKALAQQIDVRGAETGTEIELRWSTADV